MGLTLILTIIGICLALPSFIALFYSPFRATAILVIISGIAIIVFAVVFRWYTTRPPWTIIEYHKILKIKTRTGKSAKITMANKIKANHRGLTEFIHRNIRADGQIQNFYLDSNLVPQSDIKKEAQEYIVREKFPSEMRRGKY